MSSDEITLKLEKRDVIGKKLRVLREAGSIPVVVHNHGKESIHASGAHVPLEKVVAAAGRHHPIEIKIGNDDLLALIRDIDYDPRKNTIRHVVFQSIRRNRKTQAEIPIELVGDSPANQAGLMVLTQLDEVEVEALPTDLPDSIQVDATTLKEVGDTLTVADLQVPKRVTVLNDETQSIATVEMPKDQVAEADAAAEALAEDAETSGVPEEETEETAAEGAPEEEKESGEPGQPNEGEGEKS